MNFQLFRNTGRRLLLGLLFLLLAHPLYAQLSNAANTPNSNGRDTSTNKSNNENWEQEDAQIYFTNLFSAQKKYFDTSIHTVHRRPFSQPWNRDLGNLGSPSYSLLFEPTNLVGLSLGYHSFDAVRFAKDSMHYFNTTRPYSVFTYNLGSKLEQRAEIFHTQNIKPNWNVAVNYRKINSPGFYFTQRNNHDNFFLTTNYTAPSKHYQLYLSFIYNKQQHDENGGIVSDSFLSDPQFSAKKTVPTNFYNSSFSTTRSPVSTLFRDVTLQLNHAYTWGKTDTTYNEDSTSFDTKLIAKFRISHTLEIGSQRYQFKDLRPDSLRYSDYFAYKFATGDSVFMRQEWYYIDNRFLLNGLIGKESSQWLFNAGVGNRVDNFTTKFITSAQSENVIGNYLIGSLRKEAATPNQWDITANGQFFITGAAAGNLKLDGLISKSFGNNIGSIKIGASQQINNAPYRFTTYQNQYWNRLNAVTNKESISKLFAQIDLPKYKFSIAARNFILGNYLYFDETQNPNQANKTFSVAQLWLRKMFTFGNFVLDNEFVFQEPTKGAPINVPRFMGRHQFSVESKIFHRQLQIATGVEIDYTSDFYANGYAPLFNQFYVQNSYLLRNQVSAAVFFNFKIKRFRAYIMLDQAQQFFTQNRILAKGYTAQDAMLRFGFNWVLIN